MSMRVLNETPYRVGYLASMYAPGKPFMAAIIKGTFELVADGPCTPLPKSKQPKHSKLVNYRDDHGNSHKTPMDISPFKLQGEALLIGSAYAPGGVPAETVDATFSVGPMTKTLTVFGNRSWIRDADGSAYLTPSEPFTEMPIRSEYAHGGLSSKYNQHGIGFYPLGDNPGDSVPAANIMTQGQVGVSWEHDVPWAGFGMLAPNLLPRRPMLGTYDGMWRTRRRPLPPVDFNPMFFNAAPEDQRIDGYFAGDEQIVLRNLHPERAEFRTALPGTTVRCFVNRKLNPDDPEEKVFAEMRTVLDTCIVDVPAGTLTLLWRGTVEIKDRFHERVDHLLVVEEPLGDQAPAETYAALLHDKLVDKKALAAKAEEEERQKKLAAIDKKGLETAIATLKEGGAPAALIAEVEKQATVEDAQKILLDWVESTIGTSLTPSE